MIADIDKYNKGMRKSLMDKTFFIQHVDTNIYVDFGCADGALLGYLNSVEQSYCIGYDISQSMIDIAKIKNPSAQYICGTLNELKRELEKLHSDQLTLILSSVIHEVYSYSTLEYIKEFWEFVYSGIFENIVIRDLMLDVSANRQSDINDVLKVGKHPLLTDFENKWGTVENNKNLLHFLSKYRYTENWERELHENYYSITRRELLKGIPTNYEIILENHYCLPFFKKVVKKDFGITVKDNTHLKLILRKK